MKKAVKESVNFQSGFSNKRVFVTGATGFIGSHLVRRLLEAGAHVYVIARENSSLWRLEGITDDINIFRADIRDLERIKECIKASKPDFVFNMAAYGVDSRQSDYLDAANINIIGTINLLTALIPYGCKKFMGIGSCMEYGDKREIMKESSYLEPFNIYGSTKAASTLVSHAIAAENNIDIVTLRAFGIFGEYEGRHKFFPHIILSILNNTEAKLTGCEQFRDYCHVENIIDGLFLAALNEDVKNEIFNIGTGIIHPLKYYVEKVYEMMNAPGRPMYGALPYRNADVWRPRPDVSKIRKVLKWEPRISLDEGLERTIKWYSENKEKFN